MAIDAPNPNAQTPSRNHPRGAGKREGLKSRVGIAVSPVGLAINGPSPNPAISHNGPQPSPQKSETGKVLALGFPSQAKLVHSGQVLSRRVYLFLIPSVLACASTPTGGPGAIEGPPPTEAAAYYPLQRGWKWAYDVAQDGEQILATYGVQSNDGGSAVVRAGGETVTFKIEADGIVRTDGAARGDYLLKSPIAQGARWQLRSGVATVIEFGKTVELNSGRFKNCIIVEEKRIDPDRSTRTTYAAGVGAILIEYNAAEALDGEIRSLRTELRGFTKPGQDEFGEDPK